MIDGCGVAENQMIHPGRIKRGALQGRAYGTHPKRMQRDVAERFAEVAERGPRTSGKYDFGGTQHEAPQSGKGRGNWKNRQTKEEPSGKRKNAPRKEDLSGEGKNPPSSEGRRGERLTFRRRKPRLVGKKPLATVLKTAV
jgi:hypothetical protein